jgi:hypothetical protein
LLLLMREFMAEMREYRIPFDRLWIKFVGGVKGEAEQGRACFPAFRAPAPPCRLQSGFYSKETALIRSWIVPGAGLSH